MMAVRKGLPRRMGLALGSGGARGWAHIGAIDALLEAGIAITHVAGTSMGALVGAAYVSGRLDFLREFATSVDWRRILYFFTDVGVPYSGLVNGTRVTDFLRKHVTPTAIEALPVPFRCVATDVRHGTEIVLSQGDLTNAVRASIAIPGMFTPVTIDGRVLVDGGIVNPVPVSVARRMGATAVMAVDLNACRFSGDGAVPAPSPLSAAVPPRRGTRRPGRRRWSRLVEEMLSAADMKGRNLLRRVVGGSEPSIFEVLGNSVGIMETQVARVRLRADPPDLLVQPILGEFGFMDFHRAEEAIAAGYAATRRALTGAGGAAHVEAEETACETT